MGASAGGWESATRGATATDAEVTRDELAAARELLALHRTLSRIAAQSSELSDITAALAGRLQTAVWVVAPDLSTLAHDDPLSVGDGISDMSTRASQSGWDRILQVAAQTGAAIRAPATASDAAVIVAPVNVDFRVAAYVVLVERTEHRRADRALLASEHAATVVGLMMSRERSLAESVGRARAELFEGLLTARSVQSADLHRWASHLGLDPMGVYTLTIFAWTPARALQGVGQVIKHFCEGRVNSAVTSVRDTEVVVLMPQAADGPTALEIGRECLSYCAELFPGLPVVAGLSEPTRGLEDFRNAYDQARRTVAVAQRLERTNEPATLSALGVLRVILQVPDLGELRSFVDDTIGALRSYDATHGSDLVRTLAAYVRFRPSVRRMAEHLHVHHNTVAYRLGRIAAVGRIDVHDYQQLLAAQVALEISEAIGE